MLFQSRFHAQLPNQSADNGRYYPEQKAVNSLAPRLGIVGVTPRNGPLWVGFEQRLRELGYIDGQNLTIEFIQVSMGYRPFQNVICRVE
jgi:hypothetical protein